MSEAAQKERRNSIRDILSDESLTPLEKRRSIQCLMDGRRRSSNATHSSSDSGGMAHAAAEAAAYYTSDNEDDPMDASGSAASSYQYGDDVGCPTAEDGQPLHRRKGRSTSLPGWSDVGVQAVAPLAAASAKNNPNSIWDDPLNVSRRMEKSRPPCSHYERNCTIISPCCGLAFGCRICHDECPVLPMPFAKRPQRYSASGDNANMEPQPVRIHWADADAAKRRQEKRPSLPLGFDETETNHQIDRFKIAEIICRLCHVRQSSKTYVFACPFIGHSLPIHSTGFANYTFTPPLPFHLFTRLVRRNFCNTCHAQFGAYHCNICNLWMSDDESPYHCEQCGFCRVGGRENFRHCDDCGMCIDTLLFDDHNCKAGKYMSNCPVCQEDLFSSRDASHEMPCGHAIHWHCFKELTTYDTRCPVCKKTAETPEHMAPTWQAMAMGIALQPVPPELARVVTIICNDCEQRDVDRRWHFLGVRCFHCSSFNTTVERTTLTGRDAASFLDELDHMNNEDGSDTEFGVRPMDAS